MPNPCPIPNAFPFSIHSLCIHLFRCIYLDVFIYLDLEPDADIAGVPLRCPSTCWPAPEQRQFEERAISILTFKFSVE